MSLRLQRGQRDHEIALRRQGDRWCATLDGREIDVEVFDAGNGLVEVALAGRRRRVYVARTGDERWAFVAGRTLRLRCPDPDSDSGDDAAMASPDIRATMPGKVVKILVEVGQEVAFGEPVIIVESMKMETEFTASVAGEVAAVHVAEGETVGQDAPLIEIAPATESAGEGRD